MRIFDSTHGSPMGPERCSPLKAQLATLGIKSEMLHPSPSALSTRLPSPGRTSHDRTHLTHEWATAVRALPAAPRTSAHTRPTATPALAAQAPPLRPHRLSRSLTALGPRWRAASSALPPRPHRTSRGSLPAHASSTSRYGGTSSKYGASLPRSGISCINK